MWASCLWTSARHLTLSSHTSSCPNYLSPPCPPSSVSGSTASWQTGSSYWCWENTHPAPVPSALELLRAVFSPHCSSPCTWTTAHLNCSLNNLEMNTLKTVEMIVDFRRNLLALPHLPSWIALWLQWSHSGFWAPPSPRTWSGTITWSPVWKRPSIGCFFRQPRKLNLPQELLKQFYSAIIESVLCTSINVWFSSATKSDLRRLRRVVRTAERIIGTTLPTFQELYSSRVSKRAGNITLDPSHPAHSLFELHVTVWSTLQSSEHQNDQTQEQFLPSSNPAHEHLTIIMVHTLFIYLFI